MRAVQINAYGGPDKVSLNTIPQPEAAEGQVLVKVAAAGVNPVDWKIREGYMKEMVPLNLPVTMGNEFAGTIQQIGSGVTGFAVGDEVYGATGLVGAFADYVSVPPTQLIKKNAKLSMAEAAAVPVATVTAVAALEGGGVGQGTRILIHAASGGVGVIAVQLAKIRGAHVTALASPANLDFVRSLGADEAVDRTSDYETRIGDFDVVLDAHGPEAQARSWKLLKRGGIMVSLVAPPSEAEAAAHGVRGTMVFGSPNPTALSEVDKLLANGQVKVTIARSYPVEEFAAALAEVESGKVRGKVVLSFA